MKGLLRRAKPDGLLQGKAHYSTSLRQQFHEPERGELRNLAPSSVYDRQTDLKISSGSCFPRGSCQLRFLSCLCLSLTNCASTQTALAAACGAIGSFPLLHAERPTFQFTSLPTPCPTQVNFPKSCHEVPPRSRSAVLLGIAAATGESQLKTSATLTHTLDSNTPTKRLLRAYEDEERGISAKIPGLEKISSVLKSSKTKELEGLLKTGESIGNAFKTLKLSTMPIGKNGFIESKLVVSCLQAPISKLVRHPGAQAGSKWCNGHSAHERFRREKSGNNDRVG